MKTKSSRSVTVEAKTVQEGIGKALVLLGATRPQVTVQILAEENKGLFGMRGAKPAKVRVSLKDRRAVSP